MDLLLIAIIGVAAYVLIVGFLKNVQEAPGKAVQDAAKAGKEAIKETYAGGKQAGKDILAAPGYGVKKTGEGIKAGATAAASGLKKLSDTAQQETSEWLKMGGTVKGAILKLPSQMSSVAIENAARNTKTLLQFGKSTITKLAPKGSLPLSYTSKIIGQASGINPLLSIMLPQGRW